MPVGQLDAAVGLLGDIRIVRDHQYGVSRAVQLAKKSQHDLFVGLVQVAGRLIGQN